MCVCVHAGLRPFPWSSASELFIVKVMGIKRSERCREEESKEREQETSRQKKGERDSESFDHVIRSGGR